MKEKWEKFKKFYNSRFGKPLFFFAAYFVFFSIVFSLGNSTNTAGDKNSISDDIWKSINKNYEYLYEINEENKSSVILQGKKYNNKNYFTKKVEDVLENEVYIFYDEIEVKKDNEWVSNNNFVYVSDNFDNRLLDIEYLKLIIADSELTKSETNFDETRSDFYKYGLSDIEVISMDKALKQIIIMNPQYTLNFQYKNINGVQDFVVEK